VVGHGHGDPGSVSMAWVLFGASASASAGRSKAQATPSATGDRRTRGQSFPAWPELTQLPATEAAVGG
jgi:hypothetical protein